MGNVTAVTAAPALKSAPTAPNPTSGLPGGKVRSTSGQDLPPKTDPGSPADFERALKALSDALKSTSRALSFRVDKGSGRTVITVLDAATNQVVRQIPAEDVLALSRSIAEAHALLDLRI